MSKTTIPTGGITADAVNATLVADDAISDEHLDVTSITGQTAITSLADTDKFLVSDASDSGNLKYVEKQYVSSPSVLTQVATLNETSATGTLTFASCFTSTYRNYFVVFDDIQVATNGADINMLFHYGNSNGNDSTNHNFQSIMRYPSTTDTAGGNNENDIKVIQAQKNGTGRYVHGTMYVFQPLSTTDGVTAGTIFSNSNTNNGVGAQVTITSFNMPESGTNSAYTGFQFSASSGNIEGRITVYGITNPA